MHAPDYPLLSAFDPDRDVVVGAPGSRSARQLRADVGALSQALRGHTGVAPIIACRDHYHVLAAMLAVWESERVAVLPHSLDPSALDRLAQELSPALLLHDGELGAGLDVRAPLGDALGARSAALPSVPAGRPLLELHTSGSTERPRLVPKTAQQVLGEASMQAELFAFSRADVVLSAAAWHHIYGLLFGVLVPLLSGARLLRCRPNARALPAAAREAGATVLVGVPAQLATFPREEESSSALRLVLSSGAALASATAAGVERASGAEVIDLLGTTETGGIGFRRAARDERWRPLPGLRIDADPEGRLLLWSPFLPPSAERPYRAADRIEPWADGSFEYRGRSDDVVKVGGNRVNLEDIERVARSSSGVRDAVALAIPVAGIREVLVALAVEGDDVDLEAIERELRLKLEASAWPRQISRFAALPRDERGKVRVAALSRVFAARAPAASSPPASEGACVHAGK